MRQPNDPIMTNVSLAADAVSLPIPMEQEYMTSVQAVWTGAPVGDFTIETSCDLGVVNPATGAITGLNNWSTYTGSSLAAGGGAGDFTWRINSVPDRWVRLKYTSSSGSGTVNVRFQAKGV